PRCVWAQSGRGRARHGRCSPSHRSAGRDRRRLSGACRGRRADMIARTPRVVILVIDGLGIGAQADGSRSDAGSNTLRHVLTSNPALRLPHLSGLGLLRVAGFTDGGAAVASLGRWPAAAGRSALGYPGADTYLGHLVMMGAPAVQFSLALLNETGPD